MRLKPPTALLPRARRCRRPRGRKTSELFPKWVFSWFLRVLATLRAVAPNFEQVDFWTPSTFTPRWAGCDHADHHPARPPSAKGGPGGSIRQCVSQTWSDNCHVSPVAHVQTAVCTIVHLLCECTCAQGQHRRTPPSPKPPVLNKDAPMGP